MSGDGPARVDPIAAPRPGAVVRPFSAGQWCGVALLGVGVALLLAMFGEFKGVTWLHGFHRAPAWLPITLGGVLISSRRHAYVDQAPELAAARRRSLIIVVLICTAVIGAATLIEFTGATPWAF
jgi:hypothetical protein